MPKFEELTHEYAHLWETCELRPEREGQAQRAAAKVMAGRAHYEAVSGATGVPWYFIGLAHMRESYCNFATHLHNGDSLRARTIHVPAGRPAKGAPPFGWDESAIDALQIKGLQNISDWPIERVCYELERFNGMGYRNNRHGHSPYLWADTQHYQAGKYVRDGVFDASHVDTQDGCMAVLKLMLGIDPTILGGSPEVVEAVSAPKAEDAERSLTEAHLEMHDIMKGDSWLYWANRFGVSKIWAIAVAVAAFLKEHLLEVAAAALLAAIAFELVSYGQRAWRISR